MIQLREMNPEDIDDVLRIEQSVHPHPWTRGNFIGSMREGSLCKVYEDGQVMLGYTVLLPVLDEVELLNLSIAAEHQRRGLGRMLLSETMEIARKMNLRRMLLEVRSTNFAALGLYRSAGFSEIGLRRGYYLAAPARVTPVGNPLLSNDPSADNGREDAILMEYLL